MKEILIKCKGADLLPIEKIKLFEGNPKKISREDLESLIGIIADIDWIKPFHIWGQPSGEFLLLDGHQRIAAIEEMILRGYKMPAEYPVDYIEADNLTDAKRILGALDSQYGTYDKKRIKDFFQDVNTDFIRLVDTPIKLNEDPVKLMDEDPEKKFTSELLEEHNYVVLVFDNKIDWLTACEKLNIESVDALDSKVGYKRMGVGRVVKGGPVIGRIDD